MENKVFDARAWAQKFINSDAWVWTDNRAKCGEMVTELLERAYAAGLSACVVQPNGDSNPCTGDQDCKHICPAPASGAQLTGTQIWEAYRDTCEDDKVPGAGDEFWDAIAKRLAAPAGHALSEEQVREVFDKFGLWHNKDYWEFTGDPKMAMIPALCALLASQAGSPTGGR